MNETTDPPEPETNGEPPSTDATALADTRTRREAAVEIGVDERTVRRMAEDGRLAAIKGPDGAWRFRAEQVREVTIQRRTSNSVTLVENREGELFDAGINQADAVQRLRLPPRLVREMHREWADMRGGMFILEKQLRDMVARFFLSTPLQSPEHLVSELERNWPTGTCTRCDMEAPTLCVACVAALKVREAKRLAVEKEMKMHARVSELSQAKMTEGLFARRKMRAQQRETKGPERET